MRWEQLLLYLPNKQYATEEILNLCIAEEANLRCMKMKVEHSDDTNLIVVGINFYVRGAFSG
jgi:hypothetical protein